MDEIQHRAKRKYIGLALANKLAKLNSPLASMYAKSTACCNQIFVYPDGEYKSAFYCKNRWCPQCQSIKMATMINRYHTPMMERAAAVYSDYRVIDSCPGVWSMRCRLQEQQSLYLVTLTIPNCRDFHLEYTLLKMSKTWRKITDSMRKKTELFGLRKVEIKPDGKGKYHPHYHIIMQNRAHARELVRRWLSLLPECSPKAQHISRVYNIDKALLEVMKYTTKLTCAESKNKTTALAPITELDTIFRVLYRKRIYQSFGALKSFNEDDMEMKASTIQKAQGLYEWLVTDWTHYDTNEPLSDYRPDKETAQIVKALNKQ